MVVFLLISYITESWQHNTATIRDVSSVDAEGETEGKMGTDQIREAVSCASWISKDLAPGSALM